MQTNDLSSSRLSLSSFPEVGSMIMPADFPHRDIFLKGRPQHDPLSLFRIRHPQMPCSRRAKIFAPFDALKGFSEMISTTADESSREDGDR